MKRILGIVRASTERQETESQKQELIEFIKGFTYFNGTTEVRYTDDDIEIIEVAGASAWKLNSKYLEMLDTIKDTLINMRISACALWNLDRLGRNDGKLVEMKNWFIDNHIQVYCKSPYLVLFNPDNTLNEGAEIAWNVFAALVKQQTTDMFNKMHRGKKRNAEQGKYNGGDKLKFGYTVNEDNFIVINEEEAELVKLVFEEYSTLRYSFRKLAIELNARGYKFRGKKILEHNVHQILKCEQYASGLAPEWNGIQRHYQPIISKELFDRCKDIRKGNITTHIDKSTSGKIHFAIKILKCKYCGFNYVHSHDYYSCYNRSTGWKKSDHPKCEESVGIGEVIMDSLLWDVAQLYYIEMLQEMKTETVESIQQQIFIQNQKKTEASKQLNGIETRKKRLNDLYLSDPDFSKKQYEEQKSKIDADAIRITEQIKYSEQEIDRLKLKIDSVNEDSYERDIKIANDVFNEDSRKVKNNIIHQFIKEAYVENGEVDGSEGRIITIKTYSDKKEHIFFYKSHLGNELLRTYKYNATSGKWSLYPIDVQVFNIKNYQSKYEEYRKIKLANIEVPDILELISRSK